MSENAITATNNHHTITTGEVRFPARQHQDA